MKPFFFQRFSAAAVSSFNIFLFRFMSKLMDLKLMREEVFRNRMKKIFLSREFLEQLQRNLWEILRTSRWQR